MRLVCLLVGVDVTAVCQFVVIDYVIDCKYMLLVRPVWLSTPHAALFPSTKHKA